MMRSKSRSICSRDGKFSARRAMSICGLAAFAALSCQANVCSKNLLCMFEKASVPMTLAKPCARVSSCSDHIFWAVWNMSGEAVGAVNALLQKSDHILRNCRHNWAGSGGCGTAAACDQKALLFSIKSFQESNNPLGGVWFAIPDAPLGGYTARAMTRPAKLGTAYRNWPHQFGGGAAHG